MNLSKRSFLALAAIGWADGALQRIEQAGLLRAAKASGLSDADLAEVEHATKTKTTLDELDLGGMSEWDQVLTYALASWFASLDGVVSTSEHTLLVDIGNKLGLDEKLRKRAQSAAFDIACLPDGRPDKYDFDKLTARLAERLPQIAPKAEG
ncbi:MAG: hypothetical protein U0270_08775 [Labilithrix sp.]